MTKMKEKLSALQPYVLSIRFVKDLTVVDTLFKEGWSIPPSKLVGHQTTPDKPNYYMLHALDDKIDIDEILDYVTEIIKVNIEREQKLVLLQEKITDKETHLIL